MPPVIVSPATKAFDTSFNLKIFVDALKLTIVPDPSESCNESSNKF